MREFMTVYQTTLSCPVARSGLHDITEPVSQWRNAQPVEAGLLTAFLPHTSASLLLQENSDPSAKRDLEAFFVRLVPQSSQYEHDAEGPDDMPAHVRAALTQSSIVIPVIQGRLALGTWQGLYLFEHRHGRQTRRLHLHLVGD